MIDHKNKVIFIHIPRTAGTSIEIGFTGQDYWEINPLLKHLTDSLDPLFLKLNTTLILSNILAFSSIKIEFNFCKFSISDGGAGSTEPKSLISGLAILSVSR